MLIRALLVALWTTWGFIDEHTLQLQTTRAIITGPVVGLIMGNLEMGLLIGAQVELMFLAAVFVGTAVAPDVTLSASIATALACVSGNADVAIASAVLIAVIGQTMSTLQFSFVNVGLLHWAEAGNKKGDLKRIKMASYIALALDALFYGVPTFLAVYVSGAAVTTIIEKIPATLLAGLANGGGMLAAVGFGMLLTTIKVKSLWPYFVVGYIAAGYLEIGNVGIALVGVVCAFIHNYILDLVKKGAEE